MSNKIKIAVCNRKTDKKYKNQEQDWEYIKNRNRAPIRTSETAEEYPKLPKKQRDALKDHGGFVGGHLKGGIRKNGNVLCRSIGALDADHIDLASVFINEAKAALVGTEFFLYSTHSHTLQNPRYRLVILLSREVSEDEYPALMRMVANKIGMDYFDDSTYQANRMMFWASCPSNGDFVFEEEQGTALDPDSYLSIYADWHDVTQWPTSSRQSEVISHSIQSQADPVTKDGIVGAFCRTYGITAAIDTLLSDVYAPSAVTGRYDYIPADSAAGVVIYDDKFSYSHHTSDPACERLLNAFDLVRVHKFYDEDEKKSFNAMCDFASNDEKVRLQLAEERMASASDDFSDGEWQKALELDKQGKVKDTLDNLVLILRFDEQLQSIAFNCHRDGIDTKDKLPWEQIKGGWNDSDNAALKVYLSNHYGVYSPTKTKDAVLAVAAERAYHPIKEYLESLPPWDGISRVENLLIDYFGAENNNYTKAIIRKTMVAAVARIYYPGTKFDSVLILNGPQGIGKSTFFAKLAGDWFSDSLTLTDMRDKSGPEKLQGYWILELGELAGMKKADVETVKSFISRVDDKYRASYGVNVENHPRQCVVVGSTNAENGFLRDITGNRRFWPVRISGLSAKKTWQITKDDVSQIWAETLMLYKQGEKLYLEGEDAEYAVAEQADAMETDEREGLVREYLDTLLPDNWSDMDLYERRNFLNGSSLSDIGKKGTAARTTVCNMEIWCECFGKDGASMKAADSYDIAAIMRKIEDWEKNERKTYPIYGRQRGYKRNLS